MSNHNQLPDLRDNKMRTMPVGKLLFQMAVPMVISMLVQALYNVVDSIYVAGYSESAVTALSLAFPIQNLQIGFATGIGVGMNSLLSKSLGENNQERANRAAGNGLTLMGISIAVFMIFGFVGVRPYYEMQNISAETAKQGIEYSMVCCIFTAGVFVEIIGERLLQASGRTVYSMITQSVGAIINIVLDPLFIFGSSFYGLDFLNIPAMGAMGAAIATVIGQWVGAILAIYFNVTKNPDILLRFKYLKLRKDIVVKILAVGIPSIVMMVIGSVMNFGMNQIFLGFEGIGETASGVFGIYYKLQSFFFMPLFGINNATISIIAYNYGARKPKRIIKTLKLACFVAIGIMLLGLAVFQIFPDVMMGIFDGEGGNDNFMTIGISALRTISLAFPLAAVAIALSSSFQALGNGIYSTIVSLCRQMIVLLPAAYLLSLSGNVDLVWWSFPIAEVISLVATLFFFVRIYRQKIKPMGKTEE